MKLPALPRSRAQIAATLVSAILLFGIGFLPLLGGPGYEASLIAGLVLPVVAAGATAIEVALARAAPLDALGRGTLGGFVLALTGLAVTLIHGARVGFCDPRHGIVFLALGGGFGAVMGGAWGAVAGVSASWVERRRRRIALALVLAIAGPLAGVSVSFWRFYTSPMVFAFDPFFGYFGGPLYDTVVEPLAGLVSYRIGSIATLAALFALAFHLEREGDRIALVWRGRPGVVVSGVLAFVASLAITVRGDALGHWSTTETIRAELGRSVSGERCEILYAPSVLDRDAKLFADECDAHVSLLEEWFDEPYRERIVALLFESPEQKGRLMGAANTYIAKPWRREVYLQFSRYPHPVLGHELAHVVAGAHGQGPFRVAGPIAGIVPDPGRIEGVATAASPGERDDLTLQQAARAMLDLGLLPPLERVFRLSFLGENSSKAYVASGAFVDFLHRSRGAAAVKRWYAGEPLEQAAGASLAALEAEWRRSLADVVVPERALEAARARFDRPAIFQRSCPHVVDRLVQEGGAKLAANDWRGAEEDFERALVLDPHNVPARLGNGSCAARAGDLEAARERWQAVAADETQPLLVRGLGSEAIADLDLSLGNEQAASLRYGTLAEKVFDDDHLRALEVKRSPPHDLAREAIVALLIGDPRLGRDWGVAAARLAEWASEHPDEGEPDYLLGRNFYLQGRYEESARRLDRALERKLSSARVETEALRTRLIVACAQGDRAKAERAYARWLGRPDLRQAQLAATASLARRCGLTARAK